MLTPPPKRNSTRRRSNVRRPRRLAHRAVAREADGAVRERHVVREGVRRTELLRAGAVHEDAVERGKPGKGRRPAEGRVRGGIPGLRRGGGKRPGDLIRPRVVGVRRLHAARAEEDAARRVRRPVEREGPREDEPRKADKAVRREGRPLAARERGREAARLEVGRRTALPVRGGGKEGVRAAARPCRRRGRLGGSRVRDDVDKAVAGKPVRGRRRRVEARRERHAVEGRAVEGQGDVLADDDPAARRERGLLGHEAAARARLDDELRARRHVQPRKARERRTLHEAHDAVRDEQFARRMRNRLREDECRVRRGGVPDEARAAVERAREAHRVHRGRAAEGEGLRLDAVFGREAVRRVRDGGRFLDRAVADAPVPGELLGLADLDAQIRVVRIEDEAHALEEVRRVVDERAAAQAHRQVLQVGIIRVEALGEVHERTAARLDDVRARTGDALLEVERHVVGHGDDDALSGWIVRVRPADEVGPPPAARADEDARATRAHDERPLVEREGSRRGERREGWHRAAGGGDRDVAARLRILLGEDDRIAGGGHAGGADGVRPVAALARREPVVAPIALVRAAALEIPRLRRRRRRQRHADAHPCPYGSSVRHPTPRFVE